MKETEKTSDTVKIVEAIRNFHILEKVQKLTVDRLLNNGADYDMIAKDWLEKLVSDRNLQGKGIVVMSQKKVDQYKEQKAKRKELVEKERKQKKRMKALLIAVVIVVIAGIGTGIGFTIRNQYIKIQNAKPDYSSSSLVVQDMAGILQEETTQAAGEETETKEGETEAAGETETAS